MNPGITAIIITLNEEQNIEKSILSLKGFVDEILVLDSNSTDQTVMKAENVGAKVIQVTWQGYAETKNKGNQLAKNEFILSIDADEVISEQLKLSIQKAKINGLNGVYQFNRLTNYVGKWIKHAGWYPDKKIRLFHKDGAEWRGDFVHEILHVKPNHHITHLEGDLLHYSYTSIEDHQKRLKKYAKLAAQELADKNKISLFLKAIFSPIFRFLKMYLFQLGFLDGINGYWVCALTTKEVHLKYWKALKNKKLKKTTAS